MDKPSSSIDYKSEEIIQINIKKLFNKSTVISFYIKIKIILNYNKIINPDNRDIINFNTSKN